jgi:hypothetical protein
MRNTHTNIEVFIQDGKSYIKAAQVLFNSELIDSDPQIAYCMFPAAALCHHGIELILKACILWENKSIPKKHLLPKLAKNIVFLSEMTEENSNLLNVIDTYYSHRYPMDDNTITRVQNTLKQSRDTTDGIQNQAGEIGSEAIRNTLEFLNFLIQQMPYELKNIYNNSSPTIDLTSPPSE